VRNRQAFNGIEARFLVMHAHYRARASGLVGADAAQVHGHFQARLAHGFGSGLAYLLHVRQHIGSRHVGRSHEEGGIGSAEGIGQERHVVGIAGFGSGPGLLQGVEAAAGPGHGHHLVPLAEKMMN
jgi:hypothetical protein